MFLPPPQEEEFPDPSQLNKENEWFQVALPVSERTAQSGDWRIFPHLSNKESWRQRMGTRAQALDTFLQRRDIMIDSCHVCSRNGAGCPSNWAGHIAAPTHFKEIGRICNDCQDIDHLQRDWWESWSIRGGAILFNHIDGQIYMCKGMKSPALPGGAVVQRSGYGVASTPALTNGPCSVSTHNMSSCMSQMPSSSGSWSIPGRSGGHNRYIDILPEANKWYKYRDHVGIPTQKGGDYTSCQWLQSKGNWKSAMKERADVLGDILQQLQIYPNCCFCPTAGDFPGHLPAEKHFKNLAQHLLPGQSIVVVAKQPQFTCEWKVPGGAIRWFHITGMILLLRGDPSMAPPDIWHNLEPSQPPPLALPAGAGTAPSPALGQMAMATNGYSHAPNGNQTNGHQPMVAQQPVIQAHYAPNGVPSPSLGQMGCTNGQVVQAVQQGQRPLSEAEFFWRNRCEQSPEAIVQQLTKFQVPAEEIACSICGISFTSLDQLKDHLETKEHFQNLTSKAGFPQSPWADRERLRQHFHTYLGARMTLDHMSLNLHNATS